MRPWRRLHGPARPGRGRTRRHLRPGALAVWLAVGGVAVATALILAARTGRSPSAGTGAAAQTGAALPAATYTAAHPAPARPGPLPYPVLIADQGSHRLQEVTPSGRVVWSLGPQPAPPAGSVTFGPHGRSVLATGTRSAVLWRIDYYARTTLWRFGRRGHPGAAAGQLNAPTAAYLLPNGRTLVADTRNCRELTIGASGRVLATWGSPQSGFCQTDPARGLFGYPNGDQPQPNGDVLLTFGSGDRIALLGPGGGVLWNVAAPPLYGAVASNAQMLPSAAVLVTGYGSPGVVTAFVPQTGKVLWAYHPTSGPGALHDPTMALPLPGGDALVADSGGHRVLVLDPSTGRVLWSYAGKGADALRDPTGIALDVYRRWPAADARG